MSIDRCPTYNSNGSEAVSTPSGAPPNFSKSLPCFEGQTIPADNLGHSPPPSSPHLATGNHHDLYTSHHHPPNPHHSRFIFPILLQEKLNASELSLNTGSDIDNIIAYNSEGEKAESTNTDAPLNLSTSVPHFRRQATQVEEYHHPANLDRSVPPPTHPPLDIHHDLHSYLPSVHHIHRQYSTHGLLTELQAYNLAALNVSSSHPPGVPPAENIQDQSLNSLPRNNIISHHRHYGNIGSSHTSTLPQRHIQHPLPPPTQPPPVSIQYSRVTPAPSSGQMTEILMSSRNYPHPLVMPEAFPTNYDMSTNLDWDSVICDESNFSRRELSLLTCSDTFTLNSDPILRNLRTPGSQNQISAATNSSVNSIDIAHLLLQANVTSTNDKI